MDDRFARFRNATASALLRGAGATAPELRQAVAQGRPPEPWPSWCRRSAAAATIKPRRRDFWATAIG